MNTAISIKNVSKKYVIAKQKDGSLRGTLAGMFSRRQSNTEEFLALNDVSFDIQQGDVVGIIGKNGAGKSTLLKILSQITKPSTGSIEINGRVASLLEVGTGFHPELTGRENVYLNGTILGMTRKEVKAKFDEIVAFSGVEKFIDTPVKHYSSGMYVRLAFAVAAHLEPEILIIDEVLAVGDAEFQKKCLGKMGEVAGEGRTVIFVSHDLAAVKSLCNSGILLEKGKVKSSSKNIIEIIDLYLTKEGDFAKKINLESFERERGKRDIEFKSIEFDKEIYYSSSSLTVEIDLKNNEGIKKINISFHLVDNFENQVIHINNDFINCGFVTYNENHKYCFNIPKLNLKSGDYFIWLWLEGDGEEQDFINTNIPFKIEHGNIYDYDKSHVISGFYQPEFTFEVKEID